MIRLRPMRLCVHASMRRHVGITALDIALDGVHMCTYTFAVTYDESETYQGVLEPSFGGMFVGNLRLFSLRSGAVLRIICRAT